MITNNQKTAGFTLTEIMIVVAIIGLLISIAAPNYVKTRIAARSRACQNNMRQLHAAGEQYMLDNQVSTFTFTGATGNPLVGTSDYIKTNPSCPTDNSTYTMTIASQVITVTCGSDEHGTFNGSLN